MNLLIFRNSYEFFHFFYVFQNTILEKMEPGKFLCVIWNLGTDTWPKFITLRWFFKKNFKIVKRNWKNSDRFWKINKFIWNETKDRLPDYLRDNCFFCNLLITFRNYYYEKYVFLIILIWSIFSGFCYIAEYWNSDRIKLLARSLYVKYS